MKNLLLFLKQHYFLIGIIILAFLGAFLRFYDFTNRWGFAYDQAHDVIVARFAISHFKLPLLGPFSSAGPFQTGGEWYWFVMLGAILFPFFINGPWVFLAITGVIFIVLIALVGEKLLGRWFGLLCALLAAVSPSLINQSINLTNQAPLSIISLLAILLTIEYLRNKSIKSLFLLSFIISLGSAIHLQGIALIMLLLMTIFIAGIPSFVGIVAVISGLFIPWLPVFINDFSNHFYNIRNMIQYYLHDQYKIPLEAFGRRWLTYVGVFWPTAWANIAGENKIVGYVLSFGSIVIVFLSLIVRKLSKEWLVLFLSFLGMVTMLRYIRAPLFDSYLMFLVPFIIFFSAYIIYFVAKQQKIIGIIFLCIAVIFSLQKNISDIKNSGNEMQLRTVSWVKLLQKTYPHAKFAFYDYKYRSPGYSVPLVMSLQFADLLDSHGYKISFGNPNVQDDPINAHSFKAIKGNYMGFDLMDINGSTSAQLTKAQWDPINPEFIYKSTEEWYLYK